MKENRINRRKIMVSGGIQDRREEGSVDLVVRHDPGYLSAEGTLVEDDLIALFVGTEELGSLEGIVGVDILVPHGVEHGLAAAGLDVYIGDIEIEDGPCVDVGVPLCVDLVLDAVGIGVGAAEVGCDAECHHLQSLIEILFHTLPVFVHQSEMVDRVDVHLGGGLRD